MELLEMFPWGTPRSHLENVLAGHYTPHPVQNAIGLQGNLYGKPSHTVLYFRNTGADSVLSRLNVTYNTDEMDDRVTERIYNQFKEDIEESYGPANHRSGYDKSAPDKFRFSEMLQWQTSTSTIALTKRLLNDGFPRSGFGVGFTASDSINDPITKLM